MIKGSCPIGSECGWILLAVVLSLVAAFPIGFCICCIAQFGCNRTYDEDIDLPVIQNQENIV